MSSTNPQSPHDSETFTTPPTSPLTMTATQATLSRKSSRPSSLALSNAANGDFVPDVLLEGDSPGISRRPNGSQGHSSSDVSSRSHEPSVTPRIGVAPEVDSEKPQKTPNMRPMDSPCFVHSHLDKGASLTEWLRSKQLGSHPSLQNSVGTQPSISSAPTSYSGPSFDDDDDDDGYSRNLTRQLAETAVGVREMSKQLGRARIHSNIQNILIITKARDNRLIKLTREVALYLMLKKRPGAARGLVVYVDNQLRTSRRFDAAGLQREYPELFVPFPRRRSSSSTSLASMTSSTADTSSNGSEIPQEGQLRYWTSNMCSASPDLFDFVITLGGDGTVLFTSWLFQRIVPPVLPFALGSLGFLTNFDFSDNKVVLDSAIDNGIRVNLRMRFTCTVYRAVSRSHKDRKAVKKGETGEIMMKSVGEGGWEALEGGWSANPISGEGKHRDKEIMCFSTRAVETFEVLNDLVVDRGPSPFVSLLELFGDEHHMTTVQADGLTVSTPTGSTAYSLSAGGSLVHPEIPALLITPICPHTLSFRPMLLPDSMELRICVPFNSRSTAWASFDGRGRVELQQGDHIKVTASKYPFPTVCAQNQSTDWFHAISRTLKWNERERQKSFVVIEEDEPEKKKKRKQAAPFTVKPNESISEDDDGVEMDEEDEEDEDEEEEKFDIDDSSPEGPAVAKLVSNAQNPNDHSVGAEKAREVAEQDRQSHLAARALLLERERSLDRDDRNSSSTSGLSGIETPSRFAPPFKSPLQHLQNRTVNFPEEDGAREDIHSLNGRLLSSKSRIPKERESDLKTPTAQAPLYARRAVHPPRHSRARSVEPRGRRAFAVWGQDESDSNASDSDAEATWD